MTLLICSNFIYDMFLALNDSLVTPEIKNT